VTKTSPEDGLPATFFEEQQERHGRHRGVGVPVGHGPGPTITEARGGLVLLAIARQVVLGTSGHQHRRARAPQPGQTRPRRARARRVRAGRPARRRAPAPRPPGVPGRGRLPDKNAPIVVYCAGGVRRPSRPRPWATWATPTWCRSSAVSTSGRTRAAPGPRRQTLTPDQRNRYQRHLLLPEVGETGPAEAARLQGAAARRRRPRLTRPPSTWPRPGWAPSASSTWTWSTPRTCSARSCTTWTGSAMRKVDSAKKTLTAINPDVNVVTYDVRLGADNILDIIDGYDVIVDGTDNFPTRYLVNDASLLKRIPVVHGSIFRFEGQATVFDPYNGPCYRCLIPEPPPAELAPSCSEAGRARRAARHHRFDPGRRGHQDPARARVRRWSGGCWPTTPWSSRSGPSRCAGTRPARPAGPTPARSSSPSTTTSACPTEDRVDDQRRAETSRCRRRRCRRRDAPTRPTSVPSPDRWCRARSPGRLRPQDGQAWSFMVA
jgi:hypothetical protein